MLKSLLRWRAARLVLALVPVAIFTAPIAAQVALTAGTYTQTFDSIGGGLPMGWTVYTGATTSSLGTAATFNVAAMSWSATTGQWANFAAADNNGTSFVGTETGTVQNAATDRALGIRQTGAFGDPGASAAFNFSTTGQQVTAISFSAQMLSVQTRSTVWSLQYGFGASPVSWTTIGTFTDPGVFGTTVVTASGFGSVLDNQGNVWLRVVALSTSSGSGSRDTLGIDEFTIVTANLGGDVAPSIATHPQSQTVTEGATVQFTVAANGTAPLTYQWRKGTTDLANGGIISGATSDTLTLTGVAVSDAGNYNVVVTNSVSSATSNDAVLTVNPVLVAPGITTQPSPQSVAPGGTATFTVVATGNPAPSYQWQKANVNLVDGGNISGATTATLTLINVSETDAGDYRVIVSNGINPDAISNPVALSMSAVITPTGLISYAGGSYTQNFNTLPSSGTFTLTSAGPLSFTSAPISAAGLGGWSLAKYTGTGAVALFKVDAGTSTSGSAYSYGTGTNTDRALGSLSSGSTVSRFGLSVVNNTGRTITEFTLGYTGEQWRRGTGAANKLAFEYALGGTDINNGAFTAAPSLDFVAPVTTGSAAALDGNAATNRAAVSATISGLTWAPGQTIVLRWSDVDDTGSDDGLGIDDLTFTTPIDAGSILPTVAFVTPADGSVNVAVNSSVSVTFNEAVNVTGSWFTLTGSASGAHTATVTGGPTAYTLTPDVVFGEGETVTLTISAAQVTDQSTGTKHPTSDFTASFVTFTHGALPIHTVQGAGLASPYAGTSVTVQGVVVASFQGAGGIGGFYLEAPDAQHDANPATSEGVYVFDNTDVVAVGDLVTVTGTVTEYGSAPNTQTELSTITSFAVNSSANPLPTPATVSLPFPSTGYAERYEGMLVALPQTLTVTDNYDYGHFGELILSNGRLSTPTNVVAPGGPAQALESANLLNQLLLDDGSSTTYPDPTPFLSSADPATATRRAGSTTTGTTGILDNRFGTYVLEATATPVFVDANSRGPAPSPSGRLHVAIGNVQNFFNGDGVGGGFPTSRGATNFEEYQRQRAKIIAGISGIAPDIMGLTEVENDGFDANSAIADIVSGLNAAAPAGTTYAYVNGSAVEITTDVIHVAFIYRQETVETIGAPVMLNNAAFNNLARNPLAQTFREKSTGAKLTVCINHFRAKGSPASGAGNADSGDGQGTNNALRVQEANAVTAWLATDPTGSGDPDFLIIGDLNAYAKEDPLAAIENAGYTNLTEQFEGVGGYSYSFNGEFGHLDHALANSALAAQVVGAATWHVNSDEPIYYDYNTENKDLAQQAINVGTPYRYSDHDPVVVGVNLTAPPAITVQPVSQTTTVGTGVTFTVSVTGYPAPSFQWRKNGLAIAGATEASFTISNPLVADSGSYDVVVTNAIDSITSDSFTLTVNPAAATVTLGNLEQLYDGTLRNATATTNPAGLSVGFTYDGNATAPIYPGAYTVLGTINDVNYFGSATDTLVVTTTALVRHAPSLSGGIDGSLQILLPENTSLNGSAWISGDLLVPGTPTVVKNGIVNYGGTIDATGSAAPSNYTVTLNKGSVLRHVVRRVTPVAWPVVSAPPAPTGTRDVTLNSAGQSAGDFSTLRNLTLNNKVGQVAVSPGTYGTFTANKGAGFTLGATGSESPVVYNFQGLTLNGGSQLLVVGPVIVNLGVGLSSAGVMGSAAHPEWLVLNIASGGLSLTADLNGSVVAPSGTVSINGSATITGSVVADHLTINSGGVLEDAP